jgi:hypothetical protein
MIRTLPLIGGLFCLLSCSKNNGLAPDNTDTLGYSVPANPPADINFHISGVYYFFTQQINYFNFETCIQINALDGNGGMFTITIPYDSGTTVTTKYGSLLYSMSGLNWFDYYCNNALHATVTFKNDTLSGSFYGVLQYDRTYAYYPDIQGTLFNVPMAQ